MVVVADFVLGEAIVVVISDDGKVKIEHPPLSCNSFFLFFVLCYTLIFKYRQRNLTFWSLLIGTFPFKRFKETSPTHLKIFHLDIDIDISQFHFFFFYKRCVVYSEITNYSGICTIFISCGKIMREELWVFMMKFVQ